MHSKMIAAFAVIVSVILGWVATPCVAIGGDVNSDPALRAHYAEYIDQIIMHCEQKTGLRYSVSRNLRDSSSIYLMKADFYKKNRELLIEDMLDKEIQAKPYTVHYFLNQRFYAIIHEDNPDIVKGYSPPDEVSFSPE